MARLDFIIEWLDSAHIGDAFGPDNATWARLSVELDGISLTEHWETRGAGKGSTEASVTGSMSGLAEWFVENWVSIFWDVRTPFPKAVSETRVPGLRDAWGGWTYHAEHGCNLNYLGAWQHRHTLGHGSSDLALPSIVFLPEDRQVGIVISDVPYELGGNVRFRSADLRSEPTWIPKDDLASSVQRFIDQTIERSLNNSSTQRWASWLRDRFQEAERAANDDAVRRRCMFGAVVESKWEDLIHELGPNVDALSEVLVDSSQVRDEIDLRSLTDVVARTTRAWINSDSLWRQVTLESGDRLLSPYEKGYRLAGRVRQALGEPEAPLYMHEVLGRLGIELIEFDTTDLFRSAAVAGAQGGAAILFVKDHTQFGGIAPERFAMAAILGRLVGDVRINAHPFGAAHGSQSRWLKTQQANAFAAEFLLPLTALQRCADLEQLCEAYGISRSAAEYHRKNRLRTTS